MPRNMSFRLTTDQIRNRTKTVTRRTGWKHLKPGEIVNACVKCMGFKKGEKIERLCQIRIKSVKREKLTVLKRFEKYGKHEAEKEGFPEMDGQQFMEMFCNNMRVKPSDTVNRIEFEYID